MVLKANSEQPLWLPRGSVRAILALILVIATVVALILDVAGVKELVALVGPVIGFYFGTKATPQP